MPGKEEEKVEKMTSCSLTDLSDRAYDSYLASAREKEEREEREHRLLNSGFAAFEKWNGKLSFRSRLREILNGVKTSDDLKSSSRQLQKLEWMGTDTCLIYGFDNSYDPKDVSIDKLEGRDRLVADLITGIEDYDCGRPGRRFFATLLVFRRVVSGTRTSTASSTKRSRNDEEIFVGYNTFSEIEYDEIDVCKWAPLEAVSSSWYGACLKDEDNEMFVGSILNEGGLRGMFVGRSPSQSDSDSCIFYSTAIVICPVNNIIKLDEAGPNLSYNKNWWLLRSGCLVAPGSLLDSENIKQKIAHHVMKHVRERTTRDHLVDRDVCSLHKFQLEQAVDILIDSGSFSLILEFISTLTNAVKDWPNNEEQFSDPIADALIRLHTSLAEYGAVQWIDVRNNMFRLAKERLAHLTEATQNGRPILTHCQTGATFDNGAKFSGEVQEFLRGNIEVKEFGPFTNPQEADKWTKEHFGSIRTWYTTNSLEGQRAETIGKYCAEGSIDATDCRVTGTSVRLKKKSDTMQREKAELHDLYTAALDKLRPIFG